MESNLIFLFALVLVELSKFCFTLRWTLSYVDKKGQIEIIFPFCPSNQSTDQTVSQVWLNTILCPPCNSLGKLINKHNPPQSGSEGLSFTLMCASTRAHMRASFDPYTFVCRSVMLPRQRYESVLVFGLLRLFPLPPLNLFPLLLVPLRRLGLHSSVWWRSAWLSCTCGPPRAHSESKVALITVSNLPVIPSPSVSLCHRSLCLHTSSPPRLYLH